MIIDKKQVNANAEKIAKEIIESGKNQESYGTGLLMEHYIVGSLDKLSIDNLEKLRTIITKIIRKKQHTKECIKANKNEKRKNNCQ
jgi:hypothetical protein